LITVF